jgi:hypothetical protein
MRGTFRLLDLRHMEYGTRQIRMLWSAGGICKGQAEAITGGRPE